MPKWSLTKNGNVVQCKWDCKCNHEHFIGTYERAVNYFGIDESNIKSYGKLFNIVIYHQDSQFTIPKLSNELFEILMDAMAEHKYWVPKDKREEKAFEILDLAKKSGYIIDDAICKSIDEKAKDNPKQQRRKYMYEIWRSKYEFY